jgi:hypothetical protein
MTILHMKNEDWLRAAEFRLKSATTDPSSPDVLFRLSSVYSSGEEFVRAHTFYERALALLPASERDEGREAELHRLQQLAEREKATLVRIDPFDVFALELILKVMQCGNAEDRYFTLTCSWVSRKWRDVLNQGCPELWRTWIASPTSLKRKDWIAKQTAWNKRGGGSVDTVQLLDFNLTSVTKISGKIADFARGVNRLEIRARMELLVFQRLSKYFNDTACALEHLVLDNYQPHFWQRTEEYTPPKDISCGMTVDVRKLLSVELVGIIFRTKRSREIPAIPQKVDEPAIVHYPSLKRLVMKNCTFDNVTAVSESDGLEYPADAIHTAIRGATAIEHLEIITDRPIRGLSPAHPGRIRLPVLRHLTIPPHSVWNFHIDTPSLQSLAYRLPYEDWCDVGVPAMLPAILQLPTTTEALAKLRNVELLCNDRDAESGLQHLLGHMDKVKAFTLRYVGGEVYPSQEAPTGTGDGRVSINILQLLQGQLPEMQALQLRRCFVPGKELVAYVRARKATAGFAPLERLTLVKCSMLSEKAERVLAREVPDFKVVEEYGPEAETWRGPEDVRLCRLHIDDNFDEMAP